MNAWLRSVSIAVAAAKGRTAIPQFQPSSPDEEQLLALSQQWGDAEVNRDLAFLNRLLDDDFVVVAASGQITVGKDAFIKAIAEASFPAMTVTCDHIKVAGDSAIVVTTFSVRQAGGEDGQPYRCTATFARRDGTWLALGEQIGVVRGSP
jgi:ketosteroid isomerase-like protein